MAELDRFRGALLGLACGDAVGTTLEFQPRGHFEPLTDMVGGGPFHLAPGEWTDDTSMALCLAASLVACNGFDARDQMDRYVAWMQQGYMSSNGRCFDIGITVSTALRRYLATDDPFSGSADPLSAGNGSLMRLAPVALFFYPNLEAIVHYAGESSRTTHGTAECVDACRLFAAMLYKALAGKDKETILAPPHLPAETTGPAGLAPKIQAIAEGNYRDKAEAEIVGNGYVVNSLEAALWCFWRTDSYREAILQAANLGDDADTTAAICGQLAGAYYGASAIPASWLERLALRDQIEELAAQLYQVAAEREGDKGGRRVDSRG
ncbi:ADP-ribosylglycohydrolase family protein [Litorilinea aerophila]|uniref:ADP-ribosylglycohydrolase family protein n=1 Tax=Litorilinea aerophila TaxID=1204385 RepID=A0A540VGC0_9CHLR|nr:ADP-ribosylglycohydrolase family protein [Litorilinea aerophila]MCC9076496.1 ADP-ribosylglycohydrolase family protein [Litorilinea aerophila]